MEFFSDFIDIRLRPKIKSEVIGVFEDLGKVATGRTVNSVEVSRSRSGGSFSYDITIGGGAKYIQSGRSSQSKIPPIQSIKEWMDARGISGVSAYVIAKGIAINGIKPTPLNEEILERVNRRVLGVLNGSVITDFIDNELNN